MKHRLILLALSACLGWNLGQAQDPTLYFMKGLYQPTQLNPAFQDDYSVNFGFPGISSFRTGLQIRSFQPVDFLENLGNLGGVLENVNTISFETKLDLFSVGFRKNKWGFTFDMSQRIEGQADFARDLLLFFSEGNIGFVGETANFSRTGFDLALFHEYAFGYSRKIFPILTLGARVKLLRGQAALKTEHWNMSVYTTPETYDLDISSDVLIQASAPISITEKVGEPGRVDGVDMIDKEAKDYLDDYFFNSKNKGMALDIGFVATPTPRLTFAGSLTDMGSITWKQDVWEIRQDGSFTFKGIDLEPYTDTLGSENYDAIKQLTDSLAEEFKVTASQGSFETRLARKLYMGASYALSSRTTVALLSSTAFYREKTRQAFTVSGNSQVFKWLSATCAYTWSDYSPACLGLGLALKAGPLQFHLVTNNILGIRTDPGSGIPWPAYSRNLDFRFGINFRIGRIQQETASPVEMIVR